MMMRNGEAAMHGIWWGATARRRYAGAIAATLLLGMAFAAQAQPAPCMQDCASLTVGSAMIGSGSAGSVAVSFEQAHEIAAIAFTLQIGEQLGLADCTLDADGLPAAVTKGAGLSNFRVVVENASCTAGRTHCLCDTSEPDDFINLVVYGPDPLPVPGSGPVEIPPIPSGELMTIALRASGGSATVPLHIVRETDGAKPQFQAFLSVGDVNAVDQTCVPQVGTPPCSGAGAVFQVISADGEVGIGAPCTGDCDDSGTVTVDEIVRMVNIALGQQPVSACPAADSNGDGTVTVDEIVRAVNNALNGCTS